ncbi:MAG: glycosyltransferase family 39 protein [Pseudomonadota bacterium]
MARKSAKKTKARAKRSKKDTRPWALWTLLVLAAIAGVRLLINALDVVPVHFDEGQYWAYGHELAAGHFSKPPLVGWLIWAITGVAGDTTFALRIGAVAAHAAIAWFVFLTAKRLFDGQTGFWAAVGYTLAPGVTISAMIMSTDPVMMAAWAVALYAWVRAADGPQYWWVVVGVAIGAGMLAKYTMIAFAAGALGYGIFSTRDRDWRGVLITAVAALIVFAPNLIWQATNEFVTTRHVAEDAAPGGTLFNLGKLAEFLGTQLGVIGPVWFLAIIAGLFRRDWQDDQGMRKLAWQTFTLLIVITGVAFITRAHGNWAAPAYVAGSIFAARYLLTRNWHWALPVQTVIGIVAAMAVYAAAWTYSHYAQSLPRTPDPFKKMRLSQPFCEPVLAAMAEEGAEVLLSNDRRRLSECMFLGTLTFQDIAVWNQDPWPENHHELVATLQPGDHRRMILAVMDRRGAIYIARRFEEAREIESGTIRTHKESQAGYSIWVVQGFKDY